MISPGHGFLPGLRRHFTFELSTVPDSSLVTDITIVPRKFARFLAGAGMSARRPAPSRK
jgi:hypothetical protein